MANIEDMISDAKSKLPNLTPVPPAFHEQATAHELKARLLWGEPALTIVDVRDHDAFMECRIQGAINLPLQGLSEQADVNLSEHRDIYVYANTDEDTGAAVGLLRKAGFEKVAQLTGGLDAWRNIQGAVEGRAANQEPTAGAYNLGERLREFSQEKAREDQTR